MYRFNEGGQSIPLLGGLGTLALGVKRSVLAVDSEPLIHEG